MQSDLERDLLGVEGGALDMKNFWAAALALRDPRQMQGRQPFDVLRSRYRPDGQRRRTYVEMGMDLHISAEVARRLTAKALRMLRHPARLNQMRVEANDEDNA